MTRYLENEFLKIGVREHGGELCSLYSKSADYEYLWQGDKAIWSGQSPILFPIVGRLMDDKYIFEGEEYSLKKHGFARVSDWAFDESENGFSFVLNDTSETLKSYPFPFTLRVTYSLCGKTLSVSHDVINTGDNTMYFSIGAHPGFNCEIGDTLEFECEETAKTEKIDLETALRLPEKTPVLENEKEITITKDIFNEDALILNGLKSSFLTLKSQNHPREVKVTFGGAPYLGIWAKPGAPYVCIEPWFGVNDSTVKADSFKNKDEILTLPAGETFNFIWTATVSH